MRNHEERINNYLNTKKKNNISTNYENNKKYTIFPIILSIINTKIVIIILNIIIQTIKIIKI